MHVCVISEMGIFRTKICKAWTLNFGDYLWELSNFKVFEFGLIRVLACADLG